MNFPKKQHLPIGQVKKKITSPIAKSTFPGYRTTFSSFNAMPAKITENIIKVSAP